MYLQKLLTRSIFLGALFFLGIKFTNGQNVKEYDFVEAINWLESEVRKAGTQKGWEEIHLNLDIENNFHIKFSYKIPTVEGLFSKFTHSFYLDQVDTLDENIFDGYAELTALTVLERKSISISEEREIREKKEIKLVPQQHIFSDKIVFPMPSPQSSRHCKEVLRQLIRHAYFKKLERYEFEKNKIKKDTVIVKDDSDSPLIRKN